MDALHKIKNSDALAITELRTHALLIAEAGLDAVDTRKVLTESLNIEEGQICVGDSVCTLGNPRRIFVIGVGKCAAEACTVLEELLGDRLTGGIALDVKESDRHFSSKIKSFSGTHPFPSEKNIAITKQIVTLLNDLTQEDLVIAVVSGGGSTLLCLPDQRGTCLEERAILEALFAAGADIQEINTVRKHMSRARGGYLAYYAYPAQIISLVFIDVAGDDLSVVASGPTMRDTSTIADADAVLAKYHILQTCGIEHCGLSETPKDEKYFIHGSALAVVSNEYALKAMEEKARELGYTPEMHPGELSGEAREWGERVARMVGVSAPQSALLFAGETTVTVKHAGKGGRNQELALSALRFIQEGEIVVPFASDGRDNGEYAGAIADVAAREKGEAAGLNSDSFLSENNSSLFFEQTNDLLICGDTGSNVADLLVALKK